MRPGRFIQSRWNALTRAAGDRSEPTASYDATRGCWWLSWHCTVCGGAQLPLQHGPMLRTGQYDVRALEAKFGDRSCPGCETSRRRACSGPGAPSVWYDTLLSDWVVQLPHGAGAILPLEISWFDAPEVVVYRAASDLAHCHDAFER
jgi:hypothetical protein